MTQEKREAALPMVDSKRHRWNMPVVVSWPDMPRASLELGPLAVARSEGVGNDAAHQRLDIFEDDQQYLILAELPGLLAESLRVEVDPPVLTIEAERVMEGGRRVQYLRTCQLEHWVDPESVVARVKQGLLRISVGKRASPWAYRSAA